jgi:hypothetical protein
MGRGRVCVCVFLNLLAGEKTGGNNGISREAGRSSSSEKDAPDDDVRNRADEAEESKNDDAPENDLQVRRC